MPKVQRPTLSVPLRQRVTCCHCWHAFVPEETLWVSAHPDLLGDPLLGSDHQQRFLPTRFTVDGHALDVKGLPCKELACPRCHLKVPRALLEMETLYLSILGAPGSGKSYLLASMTWLIRKTLMTHFRLSFADADPDANAMVSRYHELLFTNPQEDQPVYLPKTEREGDLYESVSIGARSLQCAKPFVFSVQPEEGHPGFGNRRQMSRALCLYDNAGEHFLPGQESASSPVTQHLSLSRVLLFLFDPTQHTQFRKACRGKTVDPQMEKQLWAHQQHQIIQEAAKRIREQTGLAQSEKYARPLVVAVTKYDAWNSLTKGAPLEPGWAMRQLGSTSQWGLDVDKLKSVSEKIRGILMDNAAEVVSAVEAFSNDVIYIPVSALGRGPEVDPTSGMLTIRPRDIAPMWSEIPLLYALYRSVPGLVLSVNRASKSVRPVRSHLSSPVDSATNRVAEDQQVPRVWKETGT